MRVVSGLEGFKELVGTELGTSQWVEITSEMVQTFSDVTGDHQWIHLDSERVKKELALEGPIVQGFLTLSLVVMFRGKIITPTGISRTINYGLNRVRFLSPVIVGSRVRGTEKLLEVSPIGEDGLRLTSLCTISAENHKKPACVAEFVSLVFR